MLKTEAMYSTDSSMLPSTCRAPDRVSPVSAEALAQITRYGASVPYRSQKGLAVSDFTLFLSDLRLRSRAQDMRRVYQSIMQLAGPYNSLHVGHGIVNSPMSGNSKASAGSSSETQRATPGEAIHEFDQHADVYDAELNKALALTGEAKGYFAEERVKSLVRCVQRLQERPRSVIDFGCGIGDTCILLTQAFELGSVLGLDVSCRSIEVAGRQFASEQCSFLEFKDYVPQAAVDLVYCNGVFHHIPVAERDESVDYIRRCLRPGGLLAFWENNPWNPGTRYVMARCAFDRDAVTITPSEAVRLLRRGGFQIISLHYRFFFPRFLKWFRFLELYSSRVPLSAQYKILCRKAM